VPEEELQAESNLVRLHMQWNVPNLEKSKYDELCSAGTEHGT